MKEKDIDSLIIIALILTVIISTLSLFTELWQQKHDKKETIENQNKEKQHVSEMNELYSRISKLENDYAQITQCKASK